MNTGRLPCCSGPGLRTSSHFDLPQILLALNPGRATSYCPPRVRSFTSQGLGFLIYQIGLLIFVSQN